MEIWEPKPPGTLLATPGLLRDSSTFTYFICIYSIDIKIKNCLIFSIVLDVVGGMSAVLELGICIFTYCLKFYKYKVMLRLNICNVYINLATK